MMNDFLTMVARLIKDEGYSASPYMDINGVCTIGYGTTIMYTRRNQTVSIFTHPTDRDESLRNLYCGVAEAIKVAQYFVSNFDTLSSARQCVIVMMAYQMGNRLLKFTKTKQFIEEGYHLDASEEMLNSKWARRDSPGRAKSLADIYKRGEW